MYLFDLFPYWQVMKTVHKACLGYENWKAQNRPNHKPWLFPEQMELPRLNMTEILSMQEAQSAESIDETGINEEDLSDDMKEIEDDDDSIWVFLV